MDQQEINNLTYRRQYLLTPIPVKCNFKHIVFHLIENFHLYAHPDLNVTIHETSAIKLVLLGDLFDYEHHQKGNKDLLMDSLHEDYNVFLNTISRYAGRFVLIYIKNDNLYWVTDASASRKVFYCSKENGIFYSSNPHLLAKTIQLKLTSDPAKLSYYRSDDFNRLNNSNLGNTTCYDDVFQLMPNHYFDHLNCKYVRFWPKDPLKVLALSEVVDKSTAILKGYIRSIGHRYKIMLPVTGGKDSRLLLAATYDIRDHVFYYINNDARVEVKPYDISIPKSLLSRLNLNFHILNPDTKIDNDFKKVFFENNPFANELFLPIIYNYYVHFGNRVNLPGIFVNVAEDVYEVYGKKITPRLLAKLIRVEKFDYAESYLAEWLKGCKELCERLNFNVLNLLYWEQRVANWGTQLQLDKDIAQEDIIPYNSRLLMQTMLSAELKYREKPDFIIFTEMTKKLWPETLMAPRNPDFKSDVLKISKNLGIMKLLKNIYYRLIHLG